MAALHGTMIRSPERTQPATSSGTAIHSSTRRSKNGVNATATCTTVSSTIQCTVKRRTWR